jgi:HEAT repeat protein
MRLVALVVALFLALAALLSAQTPKDVRTVAKQGPSAIPAIAQYLNSGNADTRLEAVKQLINIGGQQTIDPLIRATRDSDPGIQMRATDGLVNYYLPGYVKQGLGSSLARAGNSIKARFGDTNDQVIDAFVIVRPDVISTLGALARGGVNMDVRANACRAIGILRGQTAIPDLLEALKSKDNDVMVEALVAIEKIRDPSVGPKITYLVRDLDDRVQAAAIDAAGVLRDKDGLPSLRAIVKNPRNKKAERAALAAIALMPAADDHPLLASYLDAKDEKLRAAAAEGLGRLGTPADIPALEKMWDAEDEKMLPRLAAAFGLVMDGKLEVSEQAPLRYLISALNQAAFHDVAYAYLVEAARHPQVRTALYGPMEQGSRDEKIYLARVFAVSGDKDSVPYLDKVSRDSDTEVAQDGLRSLRSLKARLGV